MPRFWVGCSGWSYDDWRGPFYPEHAAAGEYLARYARVFDCVEVDSSFYRPPTPFLVRRWAGVTPEGFRFSLKVPRDVTHTPTAESPRILEAFLESLRPLADAGKLGPLVAQFPASFVRGSGHARLTALLSAVPDRFRLAVELRHRSWWTSETVDELRARGAALVWSVYPGVAPPHVTTADFLYARFVGDRALTTFDRIQRDRRTEIEAMARHFREEGRSALEVYALVNNHFMGFGPGTAQIVREVLGLPAADLTLASRDPGQSVLG
ncbi:MAG TPA: DUF72 domain-containing protein [Thermoplasmata archaeon]|nr:DUF72 domain-containing protein [Thermoplasmata archaeon]